MNQGTLVLVMKKGFFGRYTYLIGVVLHYDPVSERARVEVVRCDTSPWLDCAALGFTVSPYTESVVVDSDRLIVFRPDNMGREFAMGMRAACAEPLARHYPPGHKPKKVKP